MKLIRVTPSTPQPLCAHSFLFDYLFWEINFKAPCLAAAYECFPLGNSPLCCWPGVSLNRTAIIPCNLSCTNNSKRVKPTKEECWVACKFLKGAAGSEILRTGMACLLPGGQEMTLARHRLWCPPWWPQGLAQASEDHRSLSGREDLSSSEEARGSTQVCPAGCLGLEKCWALPTPERAPRCRREQTGSRFSPVRAWSQLQERDNWGSFVPSLSFRALL